MESEYFSETIFMKFKDHGAVKNLYQVIPKTQALIILQTRCLNWREFPEEDTFPSGLKGRKKKVPYMLKKNGLTPFTDN
jgi:hypothetical protein